MFYILVYAKSVCILHLSSHWSHFQYVQKQIWSQDVMIIICLCVSFPEEDKREVGACPFSVWPRSRIEQKPISKFISHVFWYHLFFYFGLFLPLVKTSLEDLPMNYKYNIHCLHQTPTSFFPTAWISLSS